MFENLELEQCLLGAMIASNENIAKANVSLKPEYFSHKLHSRIYKKILDLYDENVMVSAVTMKSYFANDGDMKDFGGTSYLLKITAQGSGLMNIQGYVDEVIKIYQLRQLELLLESERQKLTLDTNLDDVLSRIEAATMVNKGFKIKTEKNIALEVYEELLGDLPCYATGYDKIDIAMGGGLYQGKAYSFNGGQKSGKTIVLSSLSHNLSQAGVPHLYLALEMGAKEIYKRLMARDIGKNSIAFYDQRTRKKPEFISLVADHVTNHQGTARFLDAPGLNFDRLKILLKSYVRKYGLKGIFVDYFQLIEGRARNESSSEFQDRVAKWMGDFVKEENIFMVVAGQLNREGGLRGGDGMKSAFDQVYYIHRPNEKKDRGLRWLELAESRYTIKMSIGDETSPAFIIDKKGPYLSENVVVDDFEEFTNGVTSY